MTVIIGLIDLFSYKCYNTSTNKNKHDIQRTVTLGHAGNASADIAEAIFKCHAG
jgi:hypothetical protein